MTHLTEEQMRDAMIANRLELAGLRSVAAPIVERLKRETATRPNYGKFSLTESDECAMENVETPQR